VLRLQERAVRQLARRVRRREQALPQLERAVSQQELRVLLRELAVLLREQLDPHRLLAEAPVLPRQACPASPGHQGQLPEARLRRVEWNRSFQQSAASAR
jgi:hypothetical protein